VFKPNVAKLEAKRDIEGLTKAMHFRPRSFEMDDRDLRDSAAMALARCAIQYADPAAVDALVQATQGEAPEFLLSSADRALERLSGKNAERPVNTFWPKWWAAHRQDPPQMLRDGTRRLRSVVWRNETGKIEHELPPPPRHVEVWARTEKDGSGWEPPEVSEWYAQRRQEFSAREARLRESLQTKWQAQEAAWRANDEESGLPSNGEQRCVSCGAPLVRERAAREICPYCHFRAMA
jgi:hypothetical protein